MLKATKHRKLRGGCTIGGRVGCRVSCGEGGTAARQCHGHRGWWCLPRDAVMVSPIFSHEMSEGRRSSKIAPKKSLAEHASLTCCSCLLVSLDDLACWSCWLICLSALFLHCVYYTATPPKTAPSGKSPWQWGPEKLHNCTKKVPNIA